jgi:membrane-associated PAP2 superfamily phosphatase
MKPEGTVTLRPRPGGIEGLLATALPLVVCAILLAWLSRDGLDARLAGRFFDEARGIWPSREGKWSVILHDLGRDLVFIVGITALAITLSGFAWPRVRPLRRAALFVVLCIALSTGFAAWIKSASPVPCPWFATDFGGVIPHGSPFSPAPAGVPDGHCFPGAHATGGFCFMAAYYLLRERRPKLAWYALGAGWVLGNLYGLVQVVRGAHYPSHNVWSAILAWTVGSLLYWVAFSGRLWPRRPGS